MKITERQKRFADYYIEFGNASEAYRQAYHCKNDTTARTNGQKNLKKPSIKQYLDARLESKDNERIASQDEVLRFYTDVMRGKEKDEIVCPDGFGGVFRNIKEIDAKVRIAAAKELGKRYGLDKMVGDTDRAIKVELVTGDNDEDQEED